MHRTKLEKRINLKENKLAQFNKRNAIIFLKSSIVFNFLKGYRNMLQLKNYAFISRLK